MPYHGRMVNADAAIGIAILALTAATINAMTTLVSWREAASCGGAGVVVAWMVACALVSFPGVV